MGRLFPNLMLDEYQEKAFYNALKTKGFAILAGLSGTGKTRIFNELVDNFYKLPEIELNASLLASINKFKENYETKINSKSLTEDDWHYMKQTEYETLFDEDDNLIEVPVDSIAPSIIFDLLYVEKKGDNRLELKKFCRKFLDKTENGYIDFCEAREHFGISLDNKYKICYRSDIKGNSDEKKLEEINRQLYEIKILSELGYFLPIISEDSPFYAFSLGIRKIFAFIFNPYAWMYIFDDDEIDKLHDNLFGPKVILKKVEIPSLFFPIRPDFRDSKSLLGYYNPLDNSYYSTELLDFILEAQREYIKGSKKERQYARPYFVLFDEMNLARVEYYFADFLSALESRRIDEGYIKSNKDKLREMKEILGLENSKDNADNEDNALNGFYSAPIPLYSENNVIKEEENKIPHKLYIPPNLYFVGTVNIDETTHMFSPKVLDRVFTLEFDSDIKDYADYLLSNNQQEQVLLIVDDFTRCFNYAKIDIEHIKLFLETNITYGYNDELVKINDILKPYSLHFGNRVYNEIMMFVLNSLNGIYVGKCDQHKLANVSSNDLIEIDKLDIEKFSTHNEAFDLAVRMKILPKFHETKQALEVPIMRLIGEFCEVKDLKENKIEYVKDTKSLRLDNGDDELDITEMPVLETKSGVPKLMISGKEYSAKYPHTACKLFEMLYKLRTHGFASFL